MAQMEDELGEALPFWDWTEDGEIPDLWEGIKAPIKEGEKSCKGGQVVQRNDPSLQLNKTAQKDSVRDAFDRPHFINFQEDLAEPHNRVHIEVGCDLYHTETAGYDTLFYLHHTYIDYQWAFWQELQRLRGQSDPTIEFEGFNEPLPPFDSSRFNDNAKTLRNSRSEDTLDYKQNFCYEYDRLLFDGLTPAQYLKNHQRKPVPRSSSVPEEGRCGPVCQEINGKNHCEEICSNNGGLARISVGVVLPKEAPTGINTFELCQDRKCVEAGRLGTFGDAC